MIPLIKMQLLKMKLKKQTNFLNGVSSNITIRGGRHLDTFFVQEIDSRDLSSFRIFASNKSNNKKRWKSHHQTTSSVKVGKA